MMRCFLRYVCTFILLGGATTVAQEKKDDAKKDPPRVVLISPIGVTAGMTAVLKIRGLGLADATEVKFPRATPPISATIKSKGKADAVQGVEATEAGDTQVEVELAIPSEASSTLTVVVVTPAGSTAPHELLVTDPARSTDEKEPNGGFRQPQALALPTTVRGKIEHAEDVDVFSITLQSGQTLVAEVAAARLGSALDSLLTLHDSRGNVLALNDDAGSAPSDTESDDENEASRGDPAKAQAARAKRDSALRFRCPSGGTYFLSLVDANGRGGLTHPYQLSVSTAD